MMAVSTMDIGIVVRIRVGNQYDQRLVRIKVLRVKMFCPAHMASSFNSIKLSTISIHLNTKIVSSCPNIQRSHRLTGVNVYKLVTSPEKTTLFFLPVSTRIVLGSCICFCWCSSSSSCSCLKCMWNCTPCFFLVKSDKSKVWQICSCQSWTISRQRTILESVRQDSNDVFLILINVLSLIVPIDFLTKIRNDCQWLSRKMRWLQIHSDLDEELLEKFGSWNFRFKVVSNSQVILVTLALTVTS